MRAQLPLRRSWPARCKLTIERSLWETETFGKGPIQVDYLLRDGSALRLTVQQWYLPNGQSISGTGLSPDAPAELPQSSAMFDVVQPARGYAHDTQLELALHMLGG